MAGTGFGGTPEEPRGLMVRRPDRLPPEPAVPVVTHTFVAIAARAENGAFAADSWEWE
jgi:hypothetical protein